MLTIIQIYKQLYFKTHKYILKILHISSAKTWRGGEQQVAYLMNELAKKDIPQMVLCLRDSQMEKHCQTQQIPYETYRKLFSSNPFVALKIRQICKAHQISIIHTHDSHAHTFAVLAAGIFGNKTPIVVSRRVDFPVKNSSLSKWKYNHEAVAKIVCVSNMIKEITSPAILQKEKLEVIHSGIDLARFPYKANGILRKEYGLEKDTKLIGNVAAIAPHKDYFTFVDTVKLLKESGIKAKYFIIGKDDGEKAALVEKIRTLALEEDIIFTGFRLDIPKILPELDVFLFTSKTEGLGTSLLDAFACRVPVVATNAGGIPEIVLDGKTGLSAEVGDSYVLAKNVLSLLSQTSLQQKLSQQAFTTAQQFSKKNTAEKTLHIYHKVMLNVS